MVSVEQVDAYYHFLHKLSSTWQGLPDKPEETPDITLRALWYLASDEPRSVERSIFDSLMYLSDEELDQLDNYVEIRLTGTPLAHITERQTFMGVEMLAGSGALIPRKETELLGRAALAILQDTIQERGSAKVIDLCTGYGNLALTLANYQPDCTVYGSDIFEEAIALARKNAQYLVLEERVNFIPGDLFMPFENNEFYGYINLLVCNPSTSLPPE
jgi:release factor glutamine methyltransferase